MPSWPETTLESCVALTKGVTYSASDYSGEGQGHPFLTIKSVKKGGGFNREGLKYYKGPYKPAQAVKPGEILIALTDLTRAGDIIGGPFRVPEIGAPVVLPSMDLAVLRAGEEPIDFSFLAHRLMLHDARRYMLARSAGTTVLHLDTKSALKFAFLRPALEYQKRIAEALSTVDDAIEQTEALIAKTQQIKAGLMHDLFTRGVTADGQLRPPREEAPQLYKESPLGWIPNEWDLPNLGAMAEIVSGVTLSGDNNSGHIEVPYLRVANVQDGYLDLTDVKTIHVTTAQLSKLALQRGDVLMNEGGDFDKLGRGTIWNQEIEPCVHQNHVFRVRPRSDMLGSQFLAYWSQSAFGKKYFVLSSKQSTNLASINSTQLHKFPVARPELDEQKQIANRLGAADAQCVALQNELAKLGQLKAGLMHDLLTGCVPVSVESAPELKEVLGNV